MKKINNPQTFADHLNNKMVDSYLSEKQQPTPTNDTVKDESKRANEKSIEAKVNEIADTLDHKWIDELAEEGKHEIIRHYRVQILYSARIKAESEQLKIDILNLKAAREGYESVTGKAIATLKEQNKELIEALKSISDELPKPSLAVTRIIKETADNAIAKASQITK